MKDLINAIEKSIPLVVTEWNTKKINQFETYVEQSFVKYFSNRQTQEKTKMVSPAIDVIFNRIMSEQISDFVIDEGKGRDYQWNGLPIECKLTLSTDNSWTGNGYKKTDFHILFKFELDENGYIINYFSCLVDLSKCLSDWTVPKNSNFSSLKFHNEDAENLIVIHGGLLKSQKWLNYTMVKT